MSTTYLLLIFCQSVIALVFALSGIGKAKDVAAFQEAIDDFKLLPQKWSKSVAWLFLIGEFVVVVSMVLVANLLPIGFLLATLLLITFSSALTIALWRKQKIVCNCFGQTEKRISGYDVIRNVIFILCALLGFFLSWILNSPSENLDFVSVIWVGLIGAIFVTFITNLNEIVTLYQQPPIK